MLEEHEKQLAEKIASASCQEIVIVSIDGMQYAAVQEQHLNDALEEGFVPSYGTHMINGRGWIMRLFMGT